jgi:formamidopyrimidine-DNA glycosylase
MIELPEAIAIAKQIDETLKNKIIKLAIRNHTPHTFIFPQDRELVKEKGHKSDYPPQLGEEFKDDLFSETLKGRRILKSWSMGNAIMIQIGEEYILSLGCGGEKIIYHEQEKTLPKKHQLFLEFEDQTYLTVTISGWGEVRLFKTEDLDKHPHVGYQRIDPLSDEYTFEKFNEMIEEIPDNRKRSAKYFFISEPGLRGLGNGVIQDIFFLSRIHPARQMKSLTKEERKLLYETTRKELKEMAVKGGRSTEKDLFDTNGGYQSTLYSKTAGTPCPNCATLIEKKAYLGGSVYFCPTCQKEE